MISGKQLAILAGFFPDLGERTAKEVETHIGLSHEPVFRALKSLVDSRCLKVRKVGKTSVYDFVFTEDAFLVYTYFMADRINKFKGRNRLLYKRLKEFANSVEADSVILFGSYAKGKETKESDVDTLIISEKTDVNKIVSPFKTKYNMHISPVVVKPHNFKDIKKDNPIFYSDLVKFGIVLKGMEFFFGEVYGNAKTD